MSLKNPSAFASHLGNDAYRAGNMAGHGDKYIGHTLAPLASRYKSFVHDKAGELNLLSKQDRQFVKLRYSEGYSAGKQGRNDSDKFFAQGTFMGSASTQRRKRNAGIIPGPDDVDKSLKEWGGYLRKDRRSNPMTSIVPVVRQGKQVFEAAVRSAKGAVKDTFSTIQGAEAFVRLHSHELLDSKSNPDQTIGQVRPHPWIYFQPFKGDRNHAGSGQYLDSLSEVAEAAQSYRRERLKGEWKNAPIRILDVYHAELGKVTSTGRFIPNKSGKRNPDNEAATLFEEFHGAPPESNMEVVYDEHEHETVTALGDLAQLKVITPMGKDVTLNVAPLKRGEELPDPSEMPIETRVILTSNENGTQLFFTGGDQSIDVATLGFKGDLEKEHMMLGVLYEVTYQTAKHFDKFRLTNYYHELGEETGNQPFLIYDTLSQLMRVVGGEYKIKAEGIIN